MASLSIRIDIAPGLRIGPGKVQLLEMIAEHGSISAAGRALGMSYRRAWMLIEEMNKGFGQPVVDAQIGGKAGGGARLSSLGADLVAHYRRDRAGRRPGSSAFPRSPHCTGRTHGERISFRRPLGKPLVFGQIAVSERI